MELRAAWCDDIQRSSCISSSDTLQLSTVKVVRAPNHPTVSFFALLLYLSRDLLIARSFFYVTSSSASVHVFGAVFVRPL